MIQTILDILKDLVACDTQNPPREICADGLVFQCLGRWLGDSFDVQVRDYGQGRVNWLATRGKPTRLFNVHLDTVPAGDSWTKPPLQMSVESDRVYGRGVCDIKGAAACLIAAAASVDDVAILFSSDEEGSESCCIREFCKSDLATPYASFVIAEPTGCQAVVGHRGYLSVAGHFRGQAGHTSQYQLLPASANHCAANWITHALTTVEEMETEALQDSFCFNVGRIDGGIKNNVVADQCRVTWSARMPAGFANHQLLECLIDRDCHEAQWTTTFDGAPLPGEPGQRETAAQLCQQLGLPVAPDVDFWTEAAIFAGTGKPTFVLGPGDIAQAHTADEWVAIDQLQQCVERYLNLMNKN